MIKEVNGVNGYILGEEGGSILFLQTDLVYTTHISQIIEAIKLSNEDDVNVLDILRNTTLDNGSSAYDIYGSSIKIIANSDDEVATTTETANESDDEVTSTGNPNETVIETANNNPDDVGITTKPTEENESLISEDEFNIDNSAEENEIELK